jgi:hypothetical protein
MPAPQYIPLEFQPGLWKNGTLYQARGRWFDADLMRWSVGGLGPVGGWRTWGFATYPVRTDIGGGSDTGPGRTSLTWMDNRFRRWLAVGSASKLYVYDDAAALFDITPTGFTAGRINADPNTGYGNSTFGHSSYGDSRPDLGTPVPASIWSLDLWGEDLVGVMPEDGKVYQWDASVGVPTAVIAAQVANSPEYAIANIVTSERIHMVFGGTLEADPVETDRDRRRVFWSDSEDNTDWTSTSTNLAGDQVLETKGDLLGAAKVRGQILIFTTDDAHTATFVGLPYAYQFDRVGDNCGPVNINAVAVAGNTAYWMGRSAQGFFKYDGYVTVIPCDVEDYIVTQMNESQASKVVAWHNTLFHEIVWFYPEGIENDSYVSYNYLEDHWSVGNLSRTSTTSRGIFQLPILFDPEGNPYEHEVGGTYADVDEIVRSPETIVTYKTPQVPYVESGPIQLGDGNRILSATSLIPDVTTLGDITTTFYTRLYPTDSDTTHGPYDMAAPTSVRFTGRTVRMKCISESANSWRLGVPRLEMQPGARR